MADSKLWRTSPDTSRKGKRSKQLIFLLLSPRTLCSTPVYRLSAFGHLCVKNCHTRSTISRVRKFHQRSVFSDTFVAPVDRRILPVDLCQCMFCNKFYSRKGLLSEQHAVEVTVRNHVRQSIYDPSRDT